MEDQIQENFSHGRNAYNCNITPVEMVKIEHRFQLLESDVSVLKAKMDTNTKMITEIHEKIIMQNGTLLGYKLGARSVIVVIMGVVSFLGLFLSGKLSFSELMKFFF